MPANAISNQPLARTAPGAYRPSKFEHMFELEEGRGAQLQIPAESFPHSVTVSAEPRADAAVTQEVTVMPVVAALKREVNAILSDASATGPIAAPEMAALAILTSRHAAATLAPALHGLSSEDRNAAVTEVTARPGHLDDASPFHTLLSAALSAYFGFFAETGWVPLDGRTAVDDLPMPAWRTPDGKVVCDLLVMMTPWDSDEAIERHVAPAAEAAGAAFGGRLAGVRVISPFAAFLSRWYLPDLTWAPLVGGSPFEADAS